MEKKKGPEQIWLAKWRKTRHRPDPTTPIKATDIGIECGIGTG